MFELEKRRLNEQQVALVGALKKRVREAECLLPTSRQLEILYHAIAFGRGNHEIAETLAISHKTVEVHLSLLAARLRYPSIRAMRHDLTRQYGREEMRVELVSAES